MTELSILNQMMKNTDSYESVNDSGTIVQESEELYTPELMEEIDREEEYHASATGYGVDKDREDEEQKPDHNRAVIREERDGDEYIRQSVREVEDRYFIKAAMLEELINSSPRRKKGDKKDNNEIFAARPVFPIDDEIGYTPLSERLKEILNEVRHAYVNNRYVHMSGHIRSVSEYRLNGDTVIVVNVKKGPVNIMIPLQFLMDLPAVVPGTQRDNVSFARRIANERIGSEIDFVITSLDEENLLAGGNRLVAMERKRKAFYLGKRKGRYIANKGMEVEARVCFVTKRSMCIEVQGVEVSVPLWNVSYQRVSAVSDIYSAGDRLPVTITGLDRKAVVGKEGKTFIKINLDVSVKESENTLLRKQEMLHLNEGDRMIGVVQLVSANSIYVRPGGEFYSEHSRKNYDELDDYTIDIPCSVSNEFIIRPRKGDRVLFQIYRKEEDYIRGFIIRVL